MSRADVATLGWLALAAGFGAGAAVLWRRRTGILPRIAAGGLVFLALIHLVFAVALGIFIRPFRIGGDAMAKTILGGDRILVDKRAFDFAAPRFGDVVVFHYPAVDMAGSRCFTVKQGKESVGRIVGIEGDEIEIRRRVLILNGKAVEEPYIHHDDPILASEPRTSTLTAEVYQGLWEARRLEMMSKTNPRDDFGPVRVPRGAFFVLGDARGSSCDSRYWGPLDGKDIIGKARYIYAPRERAGRID